jgi:hypothetical protein
MSFEDSSTPAGGCTERLLRLATPRDNSRPLGLVCTLISSNPFLGDSPMPSEVGQSVRLSWLDDQWVSGLPVPNSGAA